ncbi:MAG TPA: N-6 DNA methylase [Syntrophorhabdaceae bacterium]|nr:N-6 DNA methylase [Syntrophorhabdaceae bacterium]
MLDIKTLENWLWEAACKIRGPVDAPRYKDYILPLIFLKRLSDVFDEEIEKLSKEYGDKKTAEAFVEQDHSLVWFYLPKKAHWAEIVKQSTGLGEFLTDAVRAVARENPRLHGVIDIRDFNETAAGQRIISDESLKALIDVLNMHKLGLNDVEPDILGRAYEYLLRKFAEGSGQSAGEFYTPKEVAVLMAHIVDPKEGETVYDPCLGSGGLLIKVFLRFKEKYGDDPKIKPLQFYGQEILHGTYAMAKMNSFIHKMEANIALGDTMNKPAFKNPDGSLMKFDIVVANPMWNQDIFTQATYETDAFNRFVYGFPPNSSADWGWVQHMFASLQDNGRMAVVLDTGAVSRGSGNEGSNRERDIRKAFTENDFIEAVLLLPENLFYNTTSAGIILVINKNKKQKDNVLLINASKLFEKGRPKNFLPDSAIKQIAKIYLHFKEQEGISKVVTKEEVIKNDYNLSPSRYVSSNGEDTTLPLDEAVVLLKEAKEEQENAEKNLKSVLKQLGFEV